MGKTNIAWTQGLDGSSGFTWNPIRGCSIKSPGCHSCYAAAVAARFSGPGQPYEGLAYRDDKGRGRWTGKLMLAAHKLVEPIRWKKPRLVFVNSMSDLFHEDIPDEWIEAVVGVMILAPHHTYQVLTKRADRMRDFLSNASPDRCLAEVCHVGGKGIDADKLVGRWDGSMTWPAPHIWWGVSVEDQKRFDERWPCLRDTPAAVRWISYEPALGPVDFTEALPNRSHDRCRYFDDVESLPVGDMIYSRKKTLDWLVVGGESDQPGMPARPFNLGWARFAVRDCKAAGVPVFVKQLGSRPYYTVAPGDGTRTCEVGGSVALRDKKGGDIDEFPADLRVREFPGGLTR